MYLGGRGPLRRYSPPNPRLLPRYGSPDNHSSGPLFHDKDAPLAAFEARVPVKLDITSRAAGKSSPSGYLPPKDCDAA